MPDGYWLSEDHGCLRGFQGDDPFGCGRLGLLTMNVSLCREWRKWCVLGAARFGFADRTSSGRCECRTRWALEGISVRFGVCSVWRGSRAARGPVRHHFCRRDGFLEGCNGHFPTPIISVFALLALLWILSQHLMKVRESPARIVRRITFLARKIGKKFWTHGRNICVLVHAVLPKFPIKMSEMQIGPDRQSREKCVERIIARHVLFSIAVVFSEADLTAIGSIMFLPGVALDFGHLEVPYLFLL